MASVFVTGGSGFIGDRLIRRLVDDGHAVRALARSDASAAKVAAAGADAVPGDLDDVESMAAGAAGCELTFHAAAKVAEWGPMEDFVHANVDGTKVALEASRRAGVRRFIHVGTEAAILAGEALVNVDETAPLRPDSKSPYCATKAMAEQAVRDANSGELETIVVRPRFVWGPGDTSILPGLIDAVQKKRFSWVDGGNHNTSTTHVDNVVEGLILGAEKGRAGGVYFVTDGEPVNFREFVTAMLATQGVDAPERNLPGRLAFPMAAATEALWRVLRIKRAPPVTRLAVWVSALETTIDISRARSELGYEPVKTILKGIAELRGASG